MAPNSLAVSGTADVVHTFAGVTTGTWYAHASVGCLHVRPVLNLRLDKEIKAMRSIVEEAMEMVKAYKGSHSGEHGDGLVRSEFHEAMFGADLVNSFVDVKGCFDPDNLLNLPSAIGDFYSLLVTDLKPKELRSLYCMLTEETVAFEYKEVTDDMVQVLPDGALAPDTLLEIQDLITYMEDWANGTP